MIPSALLDHWRTLIGKDTERTISTTTIDASWEEIRAALYHIDPSTSREDWVSIGMALHYAGSASGQLDQACALWDEWSSQSPDKYKGPRDILNCWRSFKPDPKGIKLGTLFKLAADAGWQRPAPDVTGLFKPITESPIQIKDLLTMKTRPPVADMFMFPPLLKQYAEEIAITRGCDPLVPMWSAIAAVCGAVDNRIRLEIAPGYRVPPVLWIMTVGDPSDRKTPGSAPLMTPLYAIQAEDKPNHQARHLMWQAKEATYAAAKKALFEHVSQASNQLSNTAVPTVPELPPEPKELRLLVNDSTSQKLIHIAQGNPGGMLLYLDEMAHWIHRINDPKSGDDRGCFIAGYESRPYTMDRITAGTIHADMFSLPIYGNVQPRVLDAALTKMTEDGLLQRFILIHLTGDHTKKPRAVPTYLTCEDQYDTLIRRLRTIPQDRIYRLSDAAIEAWDKFQDWYYPYRKDEKLVKAPDAYMTALGKIEGTTARLALVLHLIESPEQLELSGELMQRAIAIATRFIVPSLRYTFGSLSEDSIESYLIDQMLIMNDSHITLRELKRTSRARWKDKHVSSIERDMLDTMSYLESANWVMLVDSTPSRNHYLWAINPDLHRLYPDYRASVIRARQAIRDQIMDRVGIDQDDPRRAIKLPRRLG